MSVSENTEVTPNDLECLKINYDVSGWEIIAEREGEHCIVPLGAVYAIRSLIAEVEFLRSVRDEILKDTAAYVLANAKIKNSCCAETRANIYTLIKGMDQK